MSKVKMLEANKYSSNGVNCICLEVGQVVDNLPENIEAAWLNRGVCELDKPVIEKETKVVEPVEEVKKAEYFTDSIPRPVTSSFSN